MIMARGKDERSVRVMMSENVKVRVAAAEEVKVERGISVSMEVGGQVLV